MHRAFVRLSSFLLLFSAAPFSHTTAAHNRTLITIIPSPTAQIAQTISPDLPDTSKFMSEILSFWNPHGEPEGAECRETSTVALDGFDVRRFLCPTGDGNQFQVDTFLQSDLNKANNESVSQVLYKYKARVVAMHITATSFTSAALKSLEDLLEEHWDALLILSVSVEDTSFLEIILKRLEERLEARNLQIVSIEYFDDSNTAHVEALTKLTESLRGLLVQTSELQDSEVPAKEETVLLPEPLMDPSGAVMNYPSLSELVDKGNLYSLIASTQWSILASGVLNLIHKITFTVQAVVRKLIQLQPSSVNTKIISPMFKMLEKAFFRGGYRLRR